MQHLGIKHAVGLKVTEGSIPLPNRGNGKAGSLGVKSGYVKYCTPQARIFGGLFNDHHKKAHAGLRGTGMGDVC